MRPKAITIIDAGGGNIESVKNALLYCGSAVKIASNASDIEKSTAIVFPGVGSFGTVMNQLREKKMDQSLIRSITRGTPYLGICLGLQLLFEKSEESPRVKGLAILEGEVVRFKRGKIPQIGWNRVNPTKKCIIEDATMYFVNSYYASPRDPSIIAAMSVYEEKFVSAIAQGNITATQFHPEKSGKVGLELLQRWLQ